MHEFRTVYKHKLDNGKKFILYMNLLIESALVYGYYHNNSLIIISLRVHAAHGHAHHVLAAVRTCLYITLNVIPK